MTIRLNEIQNWLIAILFLTGLLFSAPARAQNNSFAAAAQAPDSSATPTQTAQPIAELPEISPDAADSTRLVIRAVRDSNPQTDVELAKAMKLMVNVDQYDQARYYLSHLQAASTDDASRYLIFETLGADFFIALHANDSLQPEGRTFAKQVLASANKESYHPARIDGLVKLLQQDDISSRSAAFRSLRRLGSPAVAEILNVFANPQREEEFPNLRSALREMGPTETLGPLLGAARAANLQVQTEAIRALQVVRAPEATDIMMRTYLSPALPQSLRRVALDSLMRSHRMPADPRYVEQRLFERARSYLHRSRELPDTHLDQTMVWSWDEEANRLTGQSISADTAVRIAAARVASDLYEIQPTSIANRRLYLITQLESAKRIAGPKSKVDVNELQKRIPNLNATEVEEVLHDAIELNLIPAATASCEVLGDIGTPALLYGARNQHRTLVDAFQVGDRHLQFAALQAIAKLDPQQDFAGSSYMMLMAVYMASSDGRPIALVGDLRRDVAQSVAATLQSANLVGKSASSSREFFREAVAEPDLEVMLVTDTLDNPNYAELIQQLRNDLRTKRIPIGLLYRDTQNKIRLQRMVGDDPLFIAIPHSLDPTFVVSQVQRLRNLATPWATDGLDRRRHAEVAMAWLEKISQQRELYQFYDLGRHSQELTRLLYSPGFTESASNILVNLGTPAAQRELINFASQKELPIDARKQAAEAFHRSVEVAGPLLTSKEILQQYDRYNASESDSKSTQQVLGTILDALESRAKASN